MGYLKSLGDGAKKGVCIGIGSFLGPVGTVVGGLSSAFVGNDDDTDE